MKKINIGSGVVIGGDEFCLIAGPCVIENESLVMHTAEHLKRITDRLRVPFIFKSSFDKANRTALNSFRGPGLKASSAIFRKIKHEFRIPVLTDVHCVEQVEQISEVVDVFQIPAFLCRQTDLIIAAASTDKPVNVKKGQFMAPWEVKNIINKILSTGNEQIMLTERGTSFGYNNLVVDFRSLPIMRSFGYPVIFDATHSVQQPGGLGNSSGGQREFVEPLCRAAAAVGCEGIFLEVHPEPEKGLSDGPNMLPLDRVEPLLRKLQDLKRLFT